jgi:hypothetical protein
VIKSRGIRWSEHVACMGRRICFKFLSEIWREESILVDLGADGRIILKLKKEQGVRMWIGYVWLTKELSVRLFRTR